MKISKQGAVILEELRKLKSHPRSDELYDLVRRRLPRVSLGTVYRNLDRLQREGLVQEVYCGDFVRYDGNVSAHDHFFCQHCRRVWDTAHAESAPPGDPTPALPGFLVAGQYRMFFGLCPECQSGSTGQP